MECIVSTLFAGAVRAMPGDGRPTGIFKQPLAGPVWIGEHGLEGDAQADRRVHGGPDKAVHHFPAAHYTRLRARFPEGSDWSPGGLGENLCPDGLDEAQVCIGDVYALGEVQLQIAQPRSPCWKIDARQGVEGAAQFIEAEGMAGWYYRVLQPGWVVPGAVLRLLRRNADAVTLHRFWELRHCHRPAVDELMRLVETPGLAADWQRRWRQRLDWLRQHA